MQPDSREGQGEMPGLEPSSSTAKDDATNRIDTVKGVIGGAFGSVKATVGSVSARAGDALEHVPDPQAVRMAARRGADIARDNPLGFVLGAFGLGLLAGLLAPVSAFERERVGPIRDDLLDKAQSLGADAIAHGREVVKETAQAAVQAAQESAQAHARQFVGDQQEG